MELHPDKKQDNQQDNTVLQVNAKEIYVARCYTISTYNLLPLVTCLCFTCHLQYLITYFLSLVSISIIYYVSGYNLLYLTRQ